MLFTYGKKGEGRETKVGIAQKVAKRFQNISDSELRRPPSTQDFCAKLPILRVDVGMVHLGVENDLKATHQNDLAKK